MTWGRGSQRTFSTDQDKAEGKVSLRIRNSQARELTFYLEPWGEEYKMPSETTLELMVQGPRGDFLEVEFGDDQVKVYGWPGSTVTLFKQGTELGAGLWERTPVPPSPQCEEE
jgi:hypothetical protein